MDVQIATPAAVVVRAERRRVDRTPTVEALHRPHGRPLRVRDLATLTGLSDQKVRDDIDARALVAKRIGRGMYLVTWVEAKRYLRAMGVL
jgi:hypothetical protein